MREKASISSITLVEKIVTFEPMYELSQVAIVHKAEMRFVFLY